MFLSLCWPHIYFSLQLLTSLQAGLTESLGLTRCVPVWMFHQAPLEEELLAATTTITTAAAVKTLETQVPSMHSVLWALGLLPWALWWLFGAWYLQTRLETTKTAAAAVQERAVVRAGGNIKRPPWPSCWWAPGWSCCCCPCVWGWGTNSGSSSFCRRLRATEWPLGSRWREKRESSHRFLLKQQFFMPTAKCFVVNPNPNPRDIQFVIFYRSFLFACEMFMTLSINYLRFT